MACKRVSWKSYTEFSYVIAIEVELISCLLGDLVRKTKLKVSTIIAVMSAVSVKLNELLEREGIRQQLSATKISMVLLVMKMEFASRQCFLYSSIWSTILPMEGNL